MTDQDRIATYYYSARELVKSNNPKAARAYVLLILNAALKTYIGASSILLKARTASFMDRWIAVSRELYENGVTPYVLECFNLGGKKVKADIPRIQKDKRPETGKDDASKTRSAGDAAIDITGLIDEAHYSLGWCADVFERNKSAVAEITVTANSYAANGTGFVISAKGYLLTNDHIVFNGKDGVYYSKIYMRLPSCDKKIKLDVLFSDKKADVAFCRFDPQNLGEFCAVKRVDDYSKLKQGADCLVIGNAFGMGLAPFTGVVRFVKNDDGNLVYTAPSNPGDSGGPVFNRLGECIGINKSKTVEVNGEAALGYANATPMDTINELIKKWSSGNNIEL